MTVEGLDLLRNMQNRCIYIDQWWIVSLNNTEIQYYVRLDNNGFYAPIVGLIPLWKCDFDPETRILTCGGNFIINLNDISNEITFKSRADIMVPVCSVSDEKYASVLKKSKISSIGKKISILLGAIAVIMFINMHNLMLCGIILIVACIAFYVFHLLDS